MKTPILLYSVNTYLAFCINENFYNQLHYVYCAPYFSSRDEQGGISGGILPPRSSLPSEIYRELFLDVQSNDKDSAKIKANRLGLVRGAVAKYREGLITEEQRDEIMILVDEAPIASFYPLLYVIPYTSVEHITRVVPIRSRASLVSSEYIIERLPSNLFDIIKYETF